MEAESYQKIKLKSTTTQNGAMSYLYFFFAKIRVDHHFLRVQAKFYDSAKILLRRDEKTEHGSEKEI